MTLAMLLVYLIVSLASYHIGSAINYTKYGVGCRTGKYNWDCSLDCPSDCKYDTCHQQTGTCKYGRVCPYGWKGSDCTEYYCAECSRGQCTGPRKCKCEEDYYNWKGDYCLGKKKNGYICNEGDQCSSGVCRSGECGSYFDWWMFFKITMGVVAGLSCCCKCMHMVCGSEDEEQSTAGSGAAVQAGDMQNQETQQNPTEQQPIPPDLEPMLPDGQPPTTPYQQPMGAYEQQPKQYYGQQRYYEPQQPPQNPPPTYNEATAPQGPYAFYNAQPSAPPLPETDASVEIKT